MIQIHTFHIPNFFRRDEREDNGVYAPLQSGDNPSTPPEALVLGSAQHIAETVDPLAQLSAVQRILTKSIFVILGAAVLLPFNALITPSEYFRTRFEGTRWATSFSSWIIVVFNVSTIIFSAHATATIERTNPVSRVTLAAIAIVTALLLVTLSTTIHSSGIDLPPDSMEEPNPSLYFLGIMLACVVLSCAGSYLQNAIVSISSLFGPASMQLMIAGQGAVGAAVSVVQLLAAYSQARSVKSPRPHTASEAPSSEGPSSPPYPPPPGTGGPSQSDVVSRAAFAFFLFSTIFMAIALAAFLFLASTSIFRVTVNRNARPKVVESAQDDDAAVDEGALGASRPWDGPLVGGWRAALQRIRVINRKLLPLCLSVAYVFVVTLSVFPTLTSSIHSVNKSTSPTSISSPLIFVSLHFLLFNVSDLIGRSLPSFSAFRLRSTKAIVAATVARTIFVPLFAACNVVPPGGNNDGHHAAINSDAAFFAILVLFGLSNGLTSTSMMMVGPARPELDRSEIGLAATVLAFWLTLGLAVGSSLSFVVGAVL